LPVCARHLVRFPLCSACVVLISYTGNKRFFLLFLLPTITGALFNFARGAFSFRTISRPWTIKRRSFPILASAWPRQLPTRPCRDTTRQPASCPRRPRAPSQSLAPHRDKLRIVASPKNMTRSLLFQATDNINTSAGAMDKAGPRFPCHLNRVPGLPGDTLWSTTSGCN
jgi:hypothetical protein